VSEEAPLQNSFRETEGSRRPSIKQLRKRAFGLRRVQQWDEQEELQLKRGRIVSPGGLSTVRRRGVDTLAACERVPVRALLRRLIMSRAVRMFLPRCGRSLHESQRAVVRCNKPGTNEHEYAEQACGIETASCLHVLYRTPRVPFVQSCLRGPFCRPFCEPASGTRVRTR
jgi:hypothetical protein